MIDNEQIIEELSTSLEDLRERLEEITETQSDEFDELIDRIEDFREQFEDDMEESLDHLEELQEMVDDEPEEIDPDEFISEISSIKTAILKKLKSTRDLVETLGEELKKIGPKVTAYESEINPLFEKISKNCKDL